MGALPVFVVTVVALLSGCSAVEDKISFKETKTNLGSVDVLPTGLISNRTLRVERGSYLLNDDLIIDINSKLIILPGAEIFFAPMIGITVRGIIIAEGTPEEHISLQSVTQPILESPSKEMRLVDGQNTRAGRLQIFHNGQWRSVCSNSRRWSRANVEVACRQMGWLGGKWLAWLDREPGSKPRLLIQPNCSGTELHIRQCEHLPRQMGGPTCDFHPDISIECFPQHVTSKAVNNWRGLRFENALYSRSLTAHNTFYVPISLSKLSYIDIMFAGSGKGYNASSAIEIFGVSPQMSYINITHSAYNGINITQPKGPVSIFNTTINNNQGYGIYVNSSDGGVLVESSTISNNEGDGIRYVSHEYLPKNRGDIQDLCTLPTTAQQTFPLTISMQQSFSLSRKDCDKYFFTQPGYKLTVNFLPILTDRNASSHIQIHDGISSRDKVIASFDLYNSTKPQSVTSTLHNLYISFTAEAFTNTYALIRITSGYDKWVDIRLNNVTVAENNGKGVSVENLRSRLSIESSSISYSNHVAGVHVMNGAGQVNITDSRIAFNVGDGVNITYAGGSTNISRTSISSNLGSGITVWYNKTSPPEYISFNHSVVLEYSSLYKNLDRGILVGNFCQESHINLTGNWINRSINTAVEIESCWQENSKPMKLYVGHNHFFENEKVGMKIRPAVNLESVIEHNKFQENYYGCILIKNDPVELLDFLPSDITIKRNEFYRNKGVYVVSLGLSPYSELQSLLFTWNYVKENKIKEPFDSSQDAKVLIPRSRVAAPIVISSENVVIFRNIIENSESQFEVGAHLSDQSQMINCTYNWLGSSEEENIYYRIFDRKDRYNLAKIIYLPFLLHRSNPGATTIMNYQQFVPQFSSTSGTTVGGEVDGMENLRSGEYRVVRDINVRPGGRLILEPGVTLRFPPGIGMMVAGSLEARGLGPNDIMMSLKEEAPIEQESTTLEENHEPRAIPQANEPKVRLIGGTTSYEGTLEVQIDEKWGTVCNYGWTQRAASLACNQLGYALNPDDWLLYISDIPHAGTHDDIFLANVDCNEDDFDILKCKSQKAPEFENSCTHLQDVVMRCYPPTWAGVRLGVLAERSHLQYITIQQAGLLDYATNEFKPALQVDFSRHSFENLRLIDNSFDGLGIVYSDVFSSGLGNTAKNCEFSNNRGSGISFKQVGLRISGSKIENNRISGIRHNPVLSGLQQREIAGWFKPVSDIAAQYKPYLPIYIPSAGKNIELEEGQTKYVITQRVLVDPIQNTYYIKCNPGFAVGIQLLNPIHNRSTERIIIHDAPDPNTPSVKWDVSRDLNVFPVTSSSYGIVLQYDSGVDGLGMVVFGFSAIRVRPVTLLNRTLKGPIPTLYVQNSKIKGNRRGIWASYYNRYFTEVGEHYLRKSNESIQVIGCDISYNKDEAILVDAPHWSITPSNISEITMIFNSTQITDNGRGFFQFSRDLRNSTNLFHWSLNDNTIERNYFGGFEISLPYVWNYNENFTHTVSLQNNTWRNNRNFGITIGGHFAHLNVTENVLEENVCRYGLLSVQGMEKEMLIRNNIIQRNKGLFMAEFKIDSQSEIMGELRANFIYNLIKYNDPPAPETPSSVILFNGVQKVRIQRNLISSNNLIYSLVAGVRTARLDSTLDVSENWWGSKNHSEIKYQIFDFDDWNDHAIATYLPYLIEDSFEGSLSTSWENPTPMNLDLLSGRLTTTLELPKRDKPYRITSDLTIMPETTLILRPGVVLEFAPRIGILVLGRLEARGLKHNEIIMRPAPVETLTRSLPLVEQTVRLCTPENCSSSQGFLERWNATTQQWVPVCDERFSERNAQVTCRQLMRDNLDVWVSHGRRYNLHHSDTIRIWSWHEPLQCTGEELKLEDCEVRLNGQVYGHVHRCNWDSEFVFVHCGSTLKTHNNWGGIRFANSEFEQSDYENRIHDVVTHTTMIKKESILEFVNITGAGLLHSEKSPAILAISRSPDIMNVNLTKSADHGISLIAPNENVKLRFNWIEYNLGVGVSIASITGEGRESGESSFSPLKEILMPYRAFSLIDMCDPAKELVVQERVLLYYVYDNRPINCVKIFYSAFRLKPFGLRLLQFNLYNSTDRLDLFDGGLYNRSIIPLASLGHDSPLGAEKTFHKTRSSSLSVRLIASAASRVYGFIAEVVTLPISSIGFNRDIQHNISYSIISNNKQGGVHYVSAGEVNPKVTFEYNQITNNCIHVYGNFTTCTAAVFMDLQNTQNLYFRNNLVRKNQGGIGIEADSRGSATALKGWIHNNLFAENYNHPALSVEGRQISPYQQITVYSNFWTQNIAYYHNTIKLLQVVSNFTLNYVYKNIGAQILEVAGFHHVRLPVYQSTSHNSFYWNQGIGREYKGTVVAGTAGQQYVDNIFFNPENDYEIVTVNQSFFEALLSPVNAKSNYWGFNQTLSVMGRIRDRIDQENLLEVEFLPFLPNNASLLDGKCPPAWNLVGDTCYIFVGAPMSFYEARDFCRSTNASLPYVMGNFIDLYKFLRKQQETYQFYDRVWVQHIDKINQCTMFAFQRIEVDRCEHLSPFICEMDPKVEINILSWKSDVVAAVMMGSVCLSLLLILLVCGFWVMKSRQRHVQRLQRRASIRQSMHSLRSFGSSHTFTDAYKRGITVSSQPPSSINKSSRYKNMGGSLDSIAKSQLTSSNEEETQSYEIYESHNPAAIEAINLSYKNQGFRDAASFNSRENSTWPSHDFMNNSSTIPRSGSLALTDSTVDMKYQMEPDYNNYYERPKSSAILETNLDDTIPLQPPRSHSEAALESNQNDNINLLPMDMSTFQPLSKSQPLETAM